MSVLGAATMNIAIAMSVVAGVLCAAAMNIAVAMSVVAGVLGAAAMNIALAMSVVAGVLAWLRFRAACGAKAEPENRGAAIVLRAVWSGPEVRSDILLARL